MKYFFMAALALGIATSAPAQRSDAQARQELQQADKDVPQLIKVLALRPPMTVANIGAGFGAMAQIMAKALGTTGRVYATDLDALQLDALRAMVSQEQLRNVSVVEGGIQSTKLPDGCCDAIYMRNVYHHFTDPAAMNTSLFASLKSGGRLAIIDFEARPGSQLPAGVPANRGGNGIRAPIVVEEVANAGLVHERTIAEWPSPSGGYFLVLFRKPK